MTPRAADYPPAALFLPIPLTAVSSVTKYGAMEMEAQGEPLKMVFGKKGEPSTDQLLAVRTDVETLQGIGLKVSLVDMSGEGEPRYSIAPAVKTPMHKWRLDLEKAGFECRSNTDRENLGFTASRSPSAGKGWT